MSPELRDVLDRCRRSGSVQNTYKKVSLDDWEVILAALEPRDRVPYPKDVNGRLVLVGDVAQVLEGGYEVVSGIREDEDTFRVRFGVSDMWWPTEMVRVITGLPKTVEPMECPEPGCVLFTFPAPEPLVGYSLAAFLDNYLVGGPGC